MEITLRHVTVRELTEGYEDRQDEGVVGFGGRLDIRPPYQREFIYNDQQRDAVIDTVWAGYPLNVMYWAARADGSYEVMDGQQRTLSLCQFVNGDFAHLMRYFGNLTDDEQAKILDYELTVYVCRGTESEKLAWFRTINIAGERLYDQELLNAVYCGPFVMDAKRYFSKPGCAAYQIGAPYIKGTVNRQDFLETALKWLSEGHVEDYLAVHQHDANAAALWGYFRSVITWVATHFPHVRKEMKGVDWGTLHRLYHDRVWDVAKLEDEVSRLMADSDVTKKAGIYAYVFDHDERHLSLRAFDDNTRQACYGRQKGQCALCGKAFELKDMDADHIVPWSKGGKTTPDNCQMLCRECNIRKSNR